MKRIGIIGGLGPEATIDYYKTIINYFNEENKNRQAVYPEIVIYSVDMWKFVGLLNDGKRKEAAKYLADRIVDLENAGADFAVLSANTPHLVFDEVQDRLGIPLISIVESCAKRAKEMKLGRCLLLGTRFTMQNDFYRKVFKDFDIDIFVPDEEQIEFIHSKIFNEMELGIFTEQTKNEFLEIIADLKDKHNVDAVILGCTEFPLLFKEKEYLQLPFLNTTKIHVEAIIEECLRDN
ncbi:aspartate/glutamate racemase family protein [Maribellus mangrovi]|uniref:aspartate/glutamate racemase family protein n=1 Tax=Maribellus mangrovi TaxID=3133146 RepID=UPI0030EC1634